MLKRFKTIATQPENKPEVKKKKKVQVKKKGWNEILVIKRSAGLFRIWHIFITFLTVISSYAYAYFAAFRFDVEGTDASIYHTLMPPEEIRQYDQLEFFFETMFLIDIISQFFVEYKTPESSSPVRDLL
jgi:hypothetical protein